MVDRRKQPPKATAAATRAQSEREQRLADALRANLSRRKAQSRDRAGTSAVPDKLPSHE
jgi:hypothetical protein